MVGREAVAATCGLSCTSRLALLSDRPPHIHQTCGTVRADIRLAGCSTMGCSVPYNDTCSLCCDWLWHLLNFGSEIAAATDIDDDFQRATRFESVISYVRSNHCRMLSVCMRIGYCSMAPTHFDCAPYAVNLLLRNMLVQVDISDSVTNRVNLRLGIPLACSSHQVLMSISCSIADESDARTKEQSAPQQHPSLPSGCITFPFEASKARVTIPGRPDTQHPWHVNLAEPEIASNIVPSRANPVL
jgi:hypothetical protein